ncbi:hypothetical protein F4604DRAFT_1930282 [Suillus subluteus]|nr:hypothetical protein F4604DRAFT_1930282 [Suillus subluteus]
MSRWAGPLYRVKSLKGLSLNTTTDLLDWLHCDTDHAQWDGNCAPFHHAEPSGKLDLAPQAYTITDHLLYIKYDWPTPGIQKTTALLAKYPQGHGTIDIVVTLSQLFQPFQTSIVAPEFNDYEPFKSHPIVLEPESPMFDGLPLGQTLNVTEVLVDSSVPSMNMTGCMMNLDDDVMQPEAQADSTDTLSTIQGQYPSGKIPISLFLLTQANCSEERKQFFSKLFQWSLTVVGIDYTSLDHGQELIHIIFSEHPDSF